MPIVRVNILDPKPAAYGAAVLCSVRAGVTGGLGVPDARVTVQLTRTAAADCDLPSCRTKRFTIVDVTLYAGRTPELKAECVAAIRRNLADDPGIEPSEVTVVFHDLTPADLDVLSGEASS